MPPPELILHIGGAPAFRAHDWSRLQAIFKEVGGSIACHEFFAYGGLGLLLAMGAERKHFGVALLLGEIRVVIFEAVCLWEVG